VATLAMTAVVVLSGRRALAAVAVVLGAASNQRLRWATLLLWCAMAGRTPRDVSVPSAASPTTAPTITIRILRAALPLAVLRWRRPRAPTTSSARARRGRRARPRCTRPSTPPSPTTRSTRRTPGTADVDAETCTADLTLSVGPTAVVTESAVDSFATSCPECRRGGRITPALENTPTLPRRTPRHRPLIG
jgi:hypothetical protein